MAFRPSLRDYTSVGDHVITADWYMLIPYIPGSANPRTMSYKINTTALPGTQIEQLVSEIGARKFAFAARRVYTNTWTATIIETADGSSRSDIINWMNLARPYSTGAGSYKNQYAVTAEIRVYDAANRVAVLSEVHGLWPMQLDDASLDQASSVLQYSVQFSYDHVVESYGVDE